MKQGFQPSIAPKTSGEIIAYLEAIQNNPTYRPEGWESKCAGWTKSLSPTIRWLALTAQQGLVGIAMAERLPALLNDPNAEVVEAACIRLQKQRVSGTLPTLLNLMMTLSYQPSYDAFKAAVAQGGRLPALEAAIDQIEDCNGLEKLCDVLDHGDGVYVERSSKLNDIAALRLQWHAWIEQHRTELADGAKFNRNDPAFAGKLFPLQMQFHFADGVLWPPYADEASDTTKP